VIRQSTERICAPSIGESDGVTGDNRFPGGVGKTHSPEDFTSLFEGVVGRLFDVLPDETWVYPGHGYDTTIGAERPQLPEWLERQW
jgi:glyoxylase-like metal-dependent hydrolase (beta-lactamase superfamily II)